MKGSGEPTLARLDQLSSERLLRVVVDSAIAAVVTMDDRGIVTGWGARAEETFGWTREEALGRSLAGLIVPPRYRAAHDAGIERYRSTGEGPVLGTVRELFALHKSGHEFPVEVRISPAARVEDQTVFIAFVLDITERRRHEDELRASLDSARDARSAIDAYVTAVVHELRQPLSVTAGYADLLAHREDLPEGARFEVKALMEGALRAIRLVDDILMSARLDAGGVRADIASMDIGEAVRAAVDRVQPAASIRGGRIEVDASSPVSLIVNADAAFVARILDNLLANAIKYSRESPRIDITILRGPPVDILVADHGRGIPEEMWDTIFERFTRVEERSAVPGSGLGLYVSRQLAEMQGGTLTLRSSSTDDGSVFTLRFAHAAPDVTGATARGERSV